MTDTGMSGCDKSDCKPAKASTAEKQRHASGIDENRENDDQNKVLQLSCADRQMPCQCDARTAKLIS